MTDLSTTHLKRLLDQATPGPWTIEEDSAGELVISDELGNKLLCGDYAPFSSKGDPHLVAAAPSLAEELLRMRAQLRKITRRMDFVDGHEDYSPDEWILAELTARDLREALGDHDD